MYSGRGSCDNIDSHYRFERNPKRNLDRWDQKYPPHKRQKGRQYLNSTKSRIETSTSTNDDDERDKSSVKKCSDSFKTEVNESSNSATNDNCKENICDNNVSLKKCDKDPEKEDRLSYNTEKEKESNTMVGEENKSAINKTKESSVTMKGIGDILRQNDTERKHIERTDVKSEDVVTNTLEGDGLKQTPTKTDAQNLNKSESFNSINAINQCHELKENKTDVKNSTNKPSAIAGNDLHAESDLVPSDQSGTLTEGIAIKSVSALKDRKAAIHEKHVYPPLPPEPPNLDTSADSDEETIFFDDFISIEKIDTTKSYLPNFHPNIDNYIVVDMDMGTPSPSKRRNSEEIESSNMKMAKYDRESEINLDKMLNEISIMLGEDKQNERATSQTIKKYRSKSLSKIETNHIKNLPRTRSLQSLHSDHKISYNADLDILLFDNQELMPRAIPINNKLLSSDTKNDKIAPCDRKVVPVCTRIPEKGTSKDIHKQKEKSDEEKGKSLDGIHKESEKQSSVNILKQNGTIEDGIKSINNRAALISFRFSSSSNSQQNVSKGVQSRTVKEIERKNGHETKIIGRDNNCKGMKDSERENLDKTKKIDKDRGLIRNKRRSSDERPTKRFVDGPLVRYSDYKKSVDLSKKSLPPEMKLCTIMGGQKKLTTKLNTFSDENELHLQKMYRLFGSDSEEELENETKPDKCARDKITSKKKEEPLYKKELEKKKLVESERKHSTKPKGLDKEACFASGTDQRSTKSLAINTQKTSDSVVIESTNQLGDSHFTKRKSPKLANINQSNRRSSTSTANSTESNKSTKHQPTAPDSDTSSTAFEEKKKDKNLELVKGDSLFKSAPGTNLMQNIEKCQSRDIRKIQFEVECSKNQDIPKAVLSRVHPANADNKEKSWKVNEKNKCDDVPKENVKNMAPKKIIDVQKDGRPVQVESISSKNTLDISNQPKIVYNLQPILILNKIDQQIVQRKAQIAEKKIESSTKTSTENVFQFNLITHGLLSKDRFPPLQKARRASLTENECCDTAVVLDSPDVINKIETVKQTVLTNPSNKNSESDQIESSEDVIEIVPDIPVIDLTDEHGEMNDETIGGQLRLNKVESDSDATIKTKKDERITLYRSDETLNNRLEVQAMTESITYSSLLKRNITNKKCEDVKTSNVIKPDVIPVEGVEIIRPNIEPSLPVSEANKNSVDATNSVDNLEPTSEQLLQPTPNVTEETRLLLQSAMHKARLLKMHDIATSVSNNSQTQTNTNILRTYRPSTSKAKDFIGKENVRTTNTITCQNPLVTVTTPSVSTYTGSENVTVAPTINAQLVESNITQMIRGSTAGNQSTDILGSQRHSSRLAQILRTPEHNPSMTLNTPAKKSRKKNSGNEKLSKLAQLLGQDNSNNQVTPETTPSKQSQKRGCPRKQKSSSVLEVADRRVWSSSNVQNFYVEVATAPIGTVNNTHISGSSVPSTNPPTNQNTSQVTLVSQNQQHNDANAISIRNLLICSEAEWIQEKLLQIKLILLKYLYYQDTLRRARNAYIAELNKVNFYITDLVQNDLMNFEQMNNTKIIALSKDLVVELKNLNMKKRPTFSDLEMVMKAVYIAMKELLPDLTMSWFYLMLEALIERETTQYMNVPYMADLQAYVKYITFRIHNRRRSLQKQTNMQNNVPPQDLFTLEQRWLLRKQIKQYKDICLNQVNLIAREKNLQTDLLKAHQSNMNAKKNQVNISARTEEDAALSRSQQSSNVQGQSLRDFWRDTDPQITPACTASCCTDVPVVNNPTAPQQSIPHNSPTFRERVPPVNTTSNLNVTVPSNVIINSPSTSTFPSRRNSSDVSGAVGTTPAVIPNPSRRSSISTSGFEFAGSNLNPEGFNDNFRIRLPFTTPCNVCSSTSITSTSFVNTVAQNAPTTVPSTNISPARQRSRCTNTPPIELPNLSPIRANKPVPVCSPTTFAQPMISNSSPRPEIGEKSAPSTVEPKITSQIVDICDENDTKQDIKEQIDKEHVDVDDSLDDELNIKNVLPPIDETIETIDLTWLDDISPEQIQNEMEYIGVKKEEATEEGEEEEISEETRLRSTASPADSGISSPSVQVEYSEQVFSDRICICGRPAVYLCQCRMVMYCSQPCQCYIFHQKVCKISSTFETFYNR